MTPCHEWHNTTNDIIEFQAEAATAAARSAASHVFPADGPNSDPSSESGHSGQIPDDADHVAGERDAHRHLHGLQRAEGDPAS